MNSRQVLLVGATGVLGLQIARVLCRTGRSVRAVVRPTSDSSRRDTLQSIGAEIVAADLKDQSSIEKACHGISTIISTASATISRQDGDSIQTVDVEGQLNLVAAAERFGVQHFVYLSFSPSPIDFALQRAKRLVEEKLQAGSMSFTVLQPVHFLETWFSPAVGFDPVRGTIRYFGSGEGLVNWISLQDVARFAVAAAHDKQFSRRTVPLGGPDALSQLQVARIFQDLGAPQQTMEPVPESYLEHQLANARDPIEEAFAALMLTVARGLVVDTKSSLDLLPGRLITIRDYVNDIMRPTA